MNTPLRTPAVAATILVAIPVSGGPAATYNGGSETPAGQDLAAASVRATSVADGGF